MHTYPVMLNVKGKSAVVVGGGLIAYRKILSLLESGAHVTVVSPALHLKVEKLVVENEVTWKNKLFETSDLDSAWIVIAATDKEEINEFIALSKSDFQLVNVVDDPQLSNFHVPAKVSRGDLTIGVATGGASPVLAKVIRDEIATIYDEFYEEYLKFLVLSREKIKQLDLNRQMKEQLLKKITGEEYRKSKEKQTDFIKEIDGCLKLQ